MARGRLITIEGLDGAGKTTLATALAAALLERTTVGALELLREPGGDPVAERIRELVKDPEHPISDRAEALLYAAARAQLTEQRLITLLEQGTWVLLDRFVDSSLAYQGVGRDLGIDAVAAINRFATGGLEPDRTLLLRLDPAELQARRRGRAEAPDRLEREADAFFARIAAGYEQLAAADRRRIRVIDASAPPEAVLESALAQLADLLA